MVWEVKRSPSASTPEPARRKAGFFLGWDAARGRIVEADAAQSAVRGGGGLASTGVGGAGR